MPDPGNDQPIEYRTSGYTQVSSVTGEEVTFNALDGRDANNNNFAVANWFFKEPAPPGPKPLWEYQMDHPYDGGQTAFEPGNMFWHQDVPWYSQSRANDRYNKRPITWDNDVSHRLTILADNLACEDATGNTCVETSADVKVGDTITPFGGNDGDLRPHYYDTTRNAVVLVGGEPISNSLHTIQWKVGERWITADSAPEGATESRITFTEDAFQVGAGSPDVEVVWPAKAYDSSSGMYENPGDNGKSIRSQGSLTLNQSLEGTAFDTLPLIFPQTPTAQAGLTVEAAPEGGHQRKDNGQFTTIWHLNDRVLAPALTTGHSATTVLTLDPEFDASTLSLVEGNGWEIQSIEDNTVTLVTPTPTLTARSGDSWSLGQVTFTVDTVPNLWDDSQIVDARIHEELTVHYPAVGDLPAGNTDVATSADTVNFPVSVTASSRIVADTPTAEIADELSWTAFISAGDIGETASWSQEIRLPRNDDRVYMDDVNETNPGSTIDIDPETGLDNNGILDGIGRSRYDGDFTLKTVYIEDANDSTTVTFYNKDENGNRTGQVQRPVGPDGVVDLSGLGDFAFFEVTSSGRISGQQSAGATVHFTIDPGENQEDNDYVAWLSPPWNCRGIGTIPQCRGPIRQKW